MIKIASVETIRQVEAAVDAEGYTYAALMENAGKATARYLIPRIKGETKLTVLVGPGNNGGDGLVTGRIIAENCPEAQVRFYLLKPRSEEDPQLSAVRSAGLFVADAENDMRYRVLHNLVASSHVIIDALFGIGVRLPFEGETVKFLRAVHQALEENVAQDTSTDVIHLNNPTETLTNTRPAAPYILALDCPSGLDVTTGQFDKNIIYATETITFIAAKSGLLTFPGAEAVGNILVAPLGIRPDIEPLAAEKYTLADSAYARTLLPERPLDSNKGTHGKLLVMGGSLNYIGAPGLSAQAATVVGTGLVTVGAPQPVITPLSAQMTDITWLPLAHDRGAIAVSAASLLAETAVSYHALLIGPGMGRENTTREMLIELLTPEVSGKKRARTLGFLSDLGSAVPVQESQQLPPLVLDADALNLLSEIDGWWKLLPPNTIITPHPGEMARLAATEIAAIQAGRWKWATEKSAEWNSVIVLKGPHSLVAAPDGRLTALPFKTPALAKAGTGDVLAGIIAGFLAQGLKSYDAAVLGAYIHGLAGEFITKRHKHTRSLSPSELISVLPDVLSQIQNS